MLQSFTVGLSKRPHESFYAHWMVSIMLHLWSLLLHPPCSSLVFSFLILQQCCDWLSGPKFFPWLCTLCCLTLILLCFSPSRLCRGAGWTLWGHRYVPRGLLHHLHDCAVRLCRLHQRSAGRWRSLLYPWPVKRCAFSYSLYQLSSRHISICFAWKETSQMRNHSQLMQKLK